MRLETEWQTLSMLTLGPSLMHAADRGRCSWAVFPTIQMWSHQFLGQSLGSCDLWPAWGRTCFLTLPIDLQWGGTTAARRQSPLWTSESQMKSKDGCCHHQHGLRGQKSIRQWLSTCGSRPLWGLHMACLAFDILALWFIAVAKLVLKWQQNSLMVWGPLTWGTVLKGQSIMEVKNHWFKACLSPGKVVKA